MTDFVDDTFVVICRGDRIGRRKAPYVIATRTVFATRATAEDYARSVSVSRQALVVAGRWGQLRLPGGVR